MADQDFYTNDPFGQVIRVLDTYRNRQREQEDKDLDQKIGLLHDMITGPGANPARTADALRAMFELQAAKGGRGKPKKGAAGFLGANEEVMPDLLAQIIHGDIPMQGPTQSAVPQPASAMQQGLMPKAMPVPPMGGPSLKGFDGSTVLQEPISVPPPPLDGAPTSDRMMSAARDMQKYNEGPKFIPLPHAQQPMMIDPDELAQRQGRAAGIRAGATAKATKDAQVQIWKEAGLTDQEIQQMLKAQAIGAGANLQTQDAGYFKVGDKVIHAIRTLNPRTGMWDTVDELSGLPIPPEATVQAAPSSKTETDPTSFKEFERTIDDPAYADFLKQRRPAAADMGRERELNRFNQIVAKYQASPLIKAAARTVTLKANADAVRANPSNPAAQMAMAYSFIQAADTYQSAVREGELRNINTIDSIIGNWLNNAQRITSGQTVRPEIAIQIADYTDTLLAAINQGAQDAETMYASQAAVNGLTNEWQQFIGGAKRSYAPAGSPNVPPPPGAAAEGVGKSVSQVLIQKYATEHGIDPTAAAKIFTDKGYAVEGTDIALPPSGVKKK